MKTQKRSAHRVASASRIISLARDKHRQLTEAEQRQVKTLLTGSGPLFDRTDEKAEAFRELLVRGIGYLTPAQSRALVANDGTLGGFLAAPAVLADALVAKLEDACFVRQLATIYPVENSASFHGASTESEADDSTWTAECKAFTEDTAMSYGARDLHLHMVAKSLTISNDLLRCTSGLALDILAERMAYKTAITEEKAFLTGTGAQQPLGVFTASPAGVSTARDITAGGASGALTYDQLVETKLSLKAQYLRSPSCCWIMSRTVYKAILQLKSTTNQPLVEPSDEPGVELLLGLPVYLSEYAPSTISTGAYAAVVGDFSKYIIGSGIGPEIRILKELLADSNKTGVIFHHWVDGMPALGEAFARVKIA